MSFQIAGYARAALDSLTPAQITFLQSLPKAELHAHLNGSIPLPVLQELAAEYAASESHTVAPDAVRDGLVKLQAGVTLDALGDFAAADEHMQRSIELHTRGGMRVWAKRASTSGPSSSGRGETRRAPRPA